MNAYYRDRDPDDPPPRQWPEPPEPPEPDDRDRSYRIREVGADHEELILYDRKNPLAWIQSDLWYDLGV